MKNQTPLDAILDDAYKERPSSDDHQSLLKDIEDNIIGFPSKIHPSLGYLFKKGRKATSGETKDSLLKMSKTSL